ncbi:BolA family transcriptional regulator [Buchnera aphidicola (Aphis helianthi)]|uniref:BolA family transcriptional regulator n=1 Tax=Buchnera aphidicola (Aphis helianthi) TaxID=2315802 RepID=A0A4D6XXB3_9GAMM|nr:BolA/IbaG family iron-sulfur metabolism protein [Buchnera aphidicola]QCI17275.1 BolA family transcriptional regulator [Buchnera aphidicola (Aphis helianthi)]
MCLEKIKKYLISKINISNIEIYNDSKFHKYNQSSLTHLKIIIVSDNFINKNTINRHRLIFKRLNEIHKQKIYSITLYTYTVNEWEHKKHKKINSLKCFKKS